MASAVAEQDSSLNLTGSLPAVDSSGRLLLIDTRSKDLLLSSMVELFVSEFAGIGLAVLSDLLQLDITVWHIIGLVGKNKI